MDSGLALFARPGMTELSERKQCDEPSLRQAADRQPRRDRLPDHAHRKAHGHQAPSRSISDADRDALHVALADEAVRIGPPPARDSYLRIDAIIAAARQTGAGADPSRLRLPVRERRFRRSLRGGRAGVRRAVGQDDPADGLEVGRQGADGNVRRADRAGLSRRGSGHRDAAPAQARAHRLSGAGQGLGRRRRARHARGGRAPANLPMRSPAPSASRCRRSATTACCWRNMSRGRATSRCRCSATATAMSCRCSSANAPCSAGIRR